MTRRPLVILVCLIALVTAGIVARRVIAPRKPTAPEGPNPYAVMTQEFFAHPERFEAALARGAEADVRRSLPDARVAFVDRAVVTNLGHALRAIIAYRGEMATPEGGTRSLDAELRQYFHAGGAVVVETACFSGDSPCALPRPLIDRTDATVLQHLSDDGVSALLPAGAECDTSPRPMRSHVNRITVCRLGPDVQVSVMRLSRDETLAEFR